MNGIIRWAPFRERMSLRQAMDKLFEDSFVTPSRLRSGFDLGTVTPIDYLLNSITTRRTK